MTARTIVRLLGLLLLAALVALPSLAHAYQPLSSCNPVWNNRNLPSTYHVNRQGYSRIPLETVRQIFVDGFAEWSRPCCSAWRAVEGGLTDGVGEDNRNTQHIFSFRETTWPSQLGNGEFVLAVTLTSWVPVRTGQCTSLTGDMVFNGVNHTYATSGGRNTIDLLSVTTHEQGHWLGLDHTPITAATMYASYIGEAGRTLHPDDEAGVCFLYPGSCTCTVDGDCAAGNVCRDGTCEVPRCEGNGDCAEGQICDVASGACVVPPCEDDTDCTGGRTCISGTCVRTGDCPVCQACTEQADCGGAEYSCADFGDGEGRCVRTCSRPTDCPGDSVCFGVQGESFAVCLNPDANEAGICPESYVCTTTPSPCDGVTCGDGEICNETSGRCEERECIVCRPCTGPADCPGGECASFQGGGQVCIQDCATNADCVGGTVCTSVGLVGGGSTNICLNADADTAGICPAGFVCGAEVGDRCAGVTCRAGTTCDPDTGACVPTGSDTGIGPDAGADTGTPVDPRECTVCRACATDADCGSGDCLEINGTRLCTFDCSATGACPGDSSCFPIGDGAQSLCFNADAATAGVCRAGYTCGPAPTPTPDPDPDPTPETDAGATPTPDASIDTDGNSKDGGCACSATTPAGRNSTLLGLLLVGVAMRRRRR